MREDYFGIYAKATCLVPHDGHRKYDTMEFFYPIFRVYEDINDAFNMGNAQILGIPYEQAKEIINATEKR